MKMVKLKLLLAALGLGCLAANAQQTESAEYAAPALRSPVVAIEFTGQNCRYCPDLSRALHASQETYGKDNYLIAALHNMKSYSLFDPPHVSLYSGKAEYYGQAMDVPVGLPHVYYNSLGIYPDNDELQHMFQKPDLLECVGKVVYTDRNEYEIEVRTRLRSDRKDFISGKKVDLLFWALENDIVAIQNDNGRWTYPSHQHIFRNSINGDWGEAYQIGTAYKASWPVPAEIGVVENSEVIAFFLDHDTRMVLDAGYFKVEKAEPTGLQVVEDAVKRQDAPVYDLGGRRVTSTRKGNLYIRNRSVFIAR